MAFNKFMHERNLYKNRPPNFIELSKLFPSFKKHLKFSRTKKPFINFKDPSSLKELTTCLLEKDFGLKVSLPHDRLIPTIPSRLNYIHWVEDLFQCFPETLHQRRVLDIGCGCCCVYPLLGSKLNPDWTFVATETDAKSVEFARRNVEQNHLRDRIEVFKVEKDESLLGGREFDLCMCNPPFFCSEDEVNSSKHRPQANSACSGTKDEMVTTGGDFKFGCELFDESKKKKNEGWFTIMLGKKESAQKLKKFILENGAVTIATTELCQGNTMRWALAWSFNSEIDKSKIPKPMFSETKKERKPIKITSKFLFLTETLNEMRTILSNLNILFEIEFLNEDKVKINIQAESKSWLHGRRKKRQLVHCDVTNNKVAKLENGGNLSKNNQQILNISEIQQKVEKKSCDNKNFSEIDKNGVFLNKNSSLRDNNQLEISSGEKCSKPNEIQRTIDSIKNERDRIKLSQNCNKNMEINIFPRNQTFQDNSLKNRTFVLECSVEVAKVRCGPVNLCFSCENVSHRSDMNDLVVALKGKV